MGFLYKKREDVIFSVDIKQIENRIEMIFHCDGGKFGTDEILDIYDIDIKELLTILQEREDENK